MRNQALAASHDGIIIDPNLSYKPIVYANPALERITGYSSEETVGKNCCFLQGEDRDQPALEKLRATLREGGQCQMGLRNYRKDGTLFWNELSISPMHNEEGNLANFVGAPHNATSRKQIEETLQYQSDLMKTIMNNAAGSLFLWDAEGCSRL
ncbi:MAG: PAS domain S-box protein [Actinomycetota bacterium]|nr:PAS domain S-box protein [Actinomycetota bacterium]